VSIIFAPCNRGIRGTDKYGSGAFGASRDGGSRWHLGIDLITVLDDPIYAPADSVVTMHGIAYADDPRFRTIRLESVDEPGLQFRLLYLVPEASIGTRVSRGDRIGSAQNIGLRYPEITNHCHFEMRRQGVPVDPTKYLLDA
jgi:murein DD-endopeptidase MepM/ murein hydrolase activator NlpD